MSRLALVRMPKLPINPHFFCDLDDSADGTTICVI
jgi:hypothetical protein